MNEVKILGKSELTKVGLITHILSNLPEEYEVAVSRLEEKLKDAANPLNMEDMRLKLNSQYDCIVKEYRVKRG